MLKSLLEKNNTIINILNSHEKQIQELKKEKKMKEYVQI